eukprot:GEMP01012651.1.p1 GENE.GEMP01012651.1~~GEMP01012651.1.p1  ORF type:complete len:818 (+),score=215.94 GEMP01012651.1:25-2454(+)
MDVQELEIRLAAEIQRFENLVRQLEDRCFTIESRCDNLAQEDRVAEERLNDQESKLQQLTKQQRRTDAACAEALESLTRKCDCLDADTRSLHEKWLLQQEASLEVSARLEHQCSNLIMTQTEATKNMAEVQEKKTNVFLNRVCDHLQEITQDLEGLKCSRDAQESNIHDVCKRSAGMQQQVSQMVTEAAFTDSVHTLKNRYEEQLQNTMLIKCSVKELEGAYQDLHGKITRVSESQEAIKESSRDSREAARETAREAARETVRESAREAVREATREAAREVPCEAARDNAKSDRAMETLQETRRVIEDHSKTIASNVTHVNRLQAEVEELKHVVDAERTQVSEAVHAINIRHDDIATKHRDELLRKKEEKRTSLEHEAKVQMENEAAERRHASILHKLEAQEKAQEPVQQKLHVLESSLGALSAKLVSIEKLVNTHTANVREFATEKMVQVSLTASAEAQKTLYMELRKLMEGTNSELKTKVEALATHFAERTQVEDERYVGKMEEIRKESKGQSDRTKELILACEANARQTANSLDEIKQEMKNMKTAIEAATEAAINDAVEPLRKWRSEFSVDAETADMELTQKVRNLEQSLDAASLELHALRKDSTLKDELDHVAHQCMERFDALEQIIMQVDQDIRAELTAELAVESAKIPTDTRISEISRDLAQKEGTHLLTQIEEFVSKQFMEFESQVQEIQQRVMATSAAAENACRERKDDLNCSINHLTEEVELSKRSFTKQVENLFRSNFADQAFRSVSEDQRQQMCALESKLSQMVELLHKPDTREARRQLMPLSLQAKSLMPSPIEFA